MRGDVRISRALKAGALRLSAKEPLTQRTLGYIRAVHAGQKRIPADLATQVADHVADGHTNATGKSKVLRSIAAGNANN